jgi:hypothetical protein
MADREVEDTLREIRERVLAESPRIAHAPDAANVAAQALAHGNGVANESGDALARLQANLATTERAWSRLPPLLSYRSGFAARIELWIKRQIKRITHWFTWEQVNFNSAVNHALTDVRDALAAHERALAQVRSELAVLRDSIRSGSDALRASLDALRAEADAEKARSSELRARLTAAESRLEPEFDELRRALAGGLEEIRRALAGGLEEIRAAQRDEKNARALELQNEIRERIEHLVEEQRVCFKQLSLEAGESAVALERARRQMEARLDAMSKPDGSRQKQ